MADSKEELNYLRIISLLYKVAPSAVRTKFDKEFHPINGLETALIQDRFRVLDPLKRKRIINQVQWDLMFPPNPGTVTSSKFDLTLMICLIRHLTPIQIGDILPLKSDVREGADLSRLKYYRNMFAHRDAWTLTSKDFETYWFDICQAIQRLGGPQFKHICDDLKERILNNTDKEVLIEIRNSQKESSQVPKALQKIHEDLIDEWRENENKVVKTRAISCIEELLKTKDVIVAVGSSGCGKSTAIHHVALLLHNEEGYNIVPVHSPEDIIQYCEPKYKQVFVLDDFCGKATINHGLITRWETLSTDIQKVIEDHKVKILLSCRKHIYCDRSFEGLKLLSTACDFVSNYSLTEFERNQIARIYLTESEINVIKESGIVEKFSFFPLLCCLYSKQKLTDVPNFFAYSISVIRSDLDLLRKATDQTTLATLSLFIAFNNSLDENILSRSHSMTNLLEAIAEHFHLNARFSIKIVKFELKRLEMSYVKKTVSTYRILHDKIYDTLLSFCGEHFFDLVLEIAHRDVLRDRFVLELIKNETQNLTKDENDITVPDMEENNYFKRILKDVQKGFIKDIFLNRQFKYLTFRTNLFQYLRLEVDLSKALLDMSSEDLSNILLSMTRQCYWDMIPILLTEHVDVNVRDWKGTPLYFALEKGNVGISKLLLDHQADPNIMGWLEKGSQAPLHIAVKNGNIDLVKLLLTRNANVNVKSNFIRKETPLQVALQQQNDSIVKLLLEYKADCNRNSKFTKPPLYEAVCQGNPSLTLLLLNHMADPNIGDKISRETPLHVASSQGNIDIVKILLDNNADPTIKNELGETPLFRAIENNHTDVVKIHLETKSDLNIFNNENESLLFKASTMCQTDIVELLLENNCDFNICNKKNESPLFISCMIGHTDTVKLLLEHKCDPRICNDQNISPLFAASENGHTKIVELSLEHNSDPNKCNNENMSPLFAASKNGYIDIVRLLLKHGYDYNICNDNNTYPIFAASENGHTDIVKLLLEQNSNPQT